MKSAKPNIWEKIQNGITLPSTPDINMNKILTIFKCDRFQWWQGHREREREGRRQVKNDTIWLLSAHIWRAISFIHNSQWIHKFCCQQAAQMCSTCFWLSLSVAWPQWSWIFSDNYINLVTTWRTKYVK